MSLDATEPDVSEVVAQVAKVQPLWALLRLEDRARYMRRMAQAIVDELDELREAIAAEQSRPRTEVATLELLVAIDALKWVAHDGARVLGARRVGVHRSLSLTKRARIAYEPYGVVGVIGAGSAPFAQPLGQIAGALLAGNGVVFKPAERAAIAGERIARVLARAGLPEGLVRVVHGGADIGLELARAPVDKLLFTGSPTTGRAVARECVSQEKEVTVELGGKDAMLVLADAHVARAAAGALWAGCAGAGQARGAVERIYAAPEVTERLVARLVAGARAMTVGDPSDPRVQIGPLASERRLAHVRELVEEAVAQGATLHCGGPVAPESLVRRASAGSTGRGSGDTSDGRDARTSAASPAPSAPAFYVPAVLTGVTHEMRLMREPIGGPVLAVMTVGSVSEAIALANDTPYGLGASVWTADRYRGMRIARELDAGMVWLNDHLPSPAVSRGPWGAAAGSGLGRTLGEAGLRACAQEKLITWDPSGVRGLWWGPYDEVSARAAQTAARLRSTREGDREAALRQGGAALARAGLRALGHR
ncbi:MAG TPA: aldehyde dehydrogenase family protein [Solirubrobacteraceae bacterium]|jgi:succinate-semialdehyde dehydrogenase/glutarate-semialdehyde dehydrogenase|nr:aldehyde dehydrogenase family protein [Solirubrobacteraceae bacterium]